MVLLRQVLKNSYFGCSLVLAGAWPTARLIAARVDHGGCTVGDDRLPSPPSPRTAGV
jgi:hypothetical protein